MKSLFFPGGRNCKLLLIFSLVLLVSAGASAAITENFNDYTVATSTATASFDGDPETLFHHEIQKSGSSSSLEWGIVYTGNGDASSRYALQLGFGSAPAKNVITFNLAENEYIDSVSIEYIDWGGGTTIEIYDDSDVLDSLGTPTYGSPGTLSYTCSETEEISMIVIASANGRFDNISVTTTTVPEPVTISLLGFGVIMLRKRKRK
jgi:hypothetical protein